MSVFQPRNRRSRVDQRRAAIGADDEVRNHTKQVAAFAIAPKVVGDQTQTRKDFEIPVNRSTRARLCVVLVGEGSKSFLVVLSHAC